MLILDENGKVINRTDKSIDAVKRESYKHSNQEVLTEEEEKEDIASFVDSLEELGEEGDNIPKADLDPNAVEIAVQFAEFKANFVQTFGEEELQEAFAQFEDFFSGKGVDTTLDMSGLVAGEEGIPGMESSEQSIVTSEVEEV
jgi:tyrosyl-tRNA synthetase